jgi:5'-methylthioadenosine phosphorylase
MQTQPKLAVIGGTGLQSMPGLEKIQQLEVDTPFGKPSSPITVGELSGVPVAFLSRHGLGHHLMPGEVPYRANIYALKSLGVERIVSVSACGSLREDYSPGDIVIPNQIFDLTRGRQNTFFGEGLVGHVGVADPFCPDLSAQLFSASKIRTPKVHKGGSLVTIEGPRFSTRGESNTYRAWGMAIIGMTASPEAFLAREAEICYATMAHVTDYDVWHISEAPVSVDLVVEILNRNLQLAQKIILTLASDLATQRDCECGNALENALITDPKAVPPEMRSRLSLLVGKYLAQ